MPAKTVNVRWTRFKIRFYWALMSIGIRTEGMSYKTHLWYNQLTAIGETV